MELKGERTSEKLVGKGHCEGLHIPVDLELFSVKSVAMGGFCQRPEK
jgi:hypothetical protein